MLRYKDQYKEQSTVRQNLTQAVLGRDREDLHVGPMILHECGVRQQLLSLTCRAWQAVDTLGGNDDR